MTSLVFPVSLSLFLKLNESHKGCIILVQIKKRLKDISTNRKEADSNQPQLISMHSNTFSLFPHATHSFQYRCINILWEEV